MAYLKAIALNLEEAITAFLAEYPSVDRTPALLDRFEKGHRLYQQLAVGPLDQCGTRLVRSEHPERTRPGESTSYRVYVGVYLDCECADHVYRIGGRQQYPGACKHLAAAWLTDYARQQELSEREALRWDALVNA